MSLPQPGITPADAKAPLDPKTEQFLELAKKIMEPLKKIFNPDREYMVVKSDDLHGSDGLMKYEVSYEKDFITVKDTFIHGIKNYILAFSTMTVTVNGRPAGPNDLAIIRKRIDQAAQDHKNKRARLIVYPRMFSDPSFPGRLINIAMVAHRKLVPVRRIVLLPK